MGCQGLHGKCLTLQRSLGDSQVYPLQNSLSGGVKGGVTGSCPFRQDMGHCSMGYWVMCHPALAPPSFL